MGLAAGAEGAEEAGEEGGARGHYQRRCGLAQRRFVGDGVLDDLRHFVVETFYGYMEGGVEGLFGEGESVGVRAGEEAYAAVVGVEEEASLYQVLVDFVYSP